MNRHCFIENVFVRPGKDFDNLDLYSLVGKSRKIERNLAEHDNRLLQLVSYTVIFNPSARKAFVAERISGEERLLGTYCLGFGGHVNENDVYPFDRDAISNCAIRELREELYIRNKELDIKHIGYVRDLGSDTSEHLGIVYYMITGSASVIEKDKLDGKWISYEELVGGYYFKLESWSRHILDFIYEDPEYHKIFNF